LEAALKIVATSH